ncbi:MAG TPA: NAD(P)H-dependent oxidoreductase [Leptospiraceae bacterium]|nr:NAD(P)H-dependent oxidoreductase [Leptospiraceae bacterium]HMW04099.1 NAD(P)H-dependent oxidoreductase [Leptospiraceae bacterium]HMX30834.1 NAD(P)H-dependent oxidoreductase [Leptospiraceae bacterium]HMY30092.1 NAD(P)H-dependent oxidoreductase [Leptospiraceae bacterium]HMZ62721.1 NAD(P)H-dependent oxidoreductase [Leptospiraceae bacterium]
MQNRILILFAHPRFENSRVHKALTHSIPKSNSITFHDLYDLYPNFNIDIEIEKKLLLDHNIIIWQHPFYWYSCPPLLKQWIDMVLEFGWAYGPGGNALQGKFIFNTISTGGANEAYQENGRNRFTIKQLLAPFDQTSYLCKLKYLPPFLVQGTHRLSDQEVKDKSDEYATLLNTLTEANLADINFDSFANLNQWILQYKKV